jgi:uncharacterized membrane protein
MRLIRLLKKDLAKEASSWVDQNLISTEQAQSICRLYDIDYDSIQSYSTGYRLLVSLGYLFIGLAVITLLGANWDEIPRELRMAGLLTVTIGAHGLAFRSHLAEKQSSATGLFLLGNLFYGASIILIAQIYHLGVHMPDGVFWWALGSLPFGVLLRNSWLTLFSCLLALLWFFLEHSMGFFPTLFPLFIVAALYVLIKGQPSKLLFLTVVASTGLWVEASLSAAWADERSRLELSAENFLVSVALFIFAYAFSYWLHARESGRAKDYGVLLSLWVLRFGLIVMVVLSYEEPWRELIGSNWSHQASMWQVVIVLLGASLWLGWKTEKLQSLVPIAAFCALSMIAAVLSGNPENAIYFQVIYNIALVGSGIWLILRGVHSGTSHYFFLGIATILLTAFMRYIDLIGEYIGGAILFMVLAVVLLGAAKYWKVQQVKEARS